MTWEGVSFLHQGRSRWGVDCGGFLIGVGRALGLDMLVNFQDFTAYKRMPSKRMMGRILMQYMNPIPVNKMQPGDWYHMRYHRDPQHVAMLLPGGEIIHSSYAEGKVVRHLIDPQYFQDHVFGAYAYRGVD